METPSHSDNLHSSPVDILLKQNDRIGADDLSLLELMTQQTAGGPDSAVVTRQCTGVLTAEATEEPRGKDSMGNEAPVETTLYVASNLDTWENKQPLLVSRDTTIDGVCYRRLDPEYYAWLRYKMALAKKAMESGRLVPAIFDRLRTRFNRIA
ncbi:MAG: hypothetical protein HYX72_14520 [Acidobacteria bacterium]|nr:hypothetical protein [Acidobacteriota bacterium]